MVFKNKIFVMVFLKSLFYIRGFSVYIYIYRHSDVVSWRWSVGFLLNGWLCAHSTLFSFDLCCQSIHLQSNFWVDLHVKPRECYSVLGVHPSGVKTVLSFCFCCEYKKKCSFSLASPVNVIAGCQWLNCLTTSDSPRFFLHRHQLFK